MRFTIAAPDYTHASAGVWLLHRLAHLLSLAGHDVLVTASVLGPWNTYETLKPGEPCGIPIFPEIFDLPNPNKVPCVRWVLNIPGKLGGPKQYPPEEMVWHLNHDLEEHAKAASADGESRLLRLPTLDLNDLTPMPKDIPSVWFQGKYYGDVPPIPDPLALRITSDWPVTREETLQLLRRSKVFYCLDHYTQMTQEAFLAGAQVKHWNGVEWCDYVPIPAHIDRLIINDKNDLEMVTTFADSVAEWINKRAMDGGGLKKLVSIIVLVHNQLYYTKQCLDSLFRYTDQPFELIVVDNNSTDGTPEYLNELRRRVVDVGGWRVKTGQESDRTEWHANAADQVMLVGESSSVLGGDHGKAEGEPACRSFKVIRNEKNLGFAGGNNQGLAVASGEYLLLLNNDIVVTPGWLSRMVNCIERGPQVGIVGPMSNHVSGPQLLKDVSYDTGSLVGLNEFARDHAARFHGQAQAFWRVVGFCMLIKKEVVAKIGGLDSRYGQGNFEDDDFSLRSSLAGFESWIAQDAFVHHFGNRTFFGAAIDYNQSLNNNWEVFKKKWGIPPDVPYGAPYDRMKLLSQRFMAHEHYFPIKPVSSSQAVTFEGAGKETRGDECIPCPAAAEMPLPSSAPFNGSDILNRQGELQFRMGKLAHARTCFELAIEHNPSHSKAHSNLGVLLCREGELEMALEYLHRALKLDPEDADILYNSAKALAAVEELDLARDLLKFCLQQNPWDEDTWKDYASLIHRNDIPVWQPNMLSAEVADIYAAMGRELIDAKDYQGAADALHRALILNARQDEALFQMERLRQKLEDLSRG